ncbi:type VI secretion system TssO [Xanthovirga aplysinae]|uniref:type VI secretion system TssO n=1 Tax=Xanthovirga aplysinae TaxID=2529853 RepID=UPI0012BC2278|nr:type VI secretion system TssO [Xanthovirga aplysinae]MTI31845.1 hypothetical protein [Xanthovirga aplysinae]
MEVLNKKERIRAFLLFLLLFIITMAMVVLAIFFDFQLPLEQNKLLKAENQRISKEIDFQLKYKEHMFKTKHLLDSINLEGQNSSYLQQLVGAELIDMQKITQNEPQVNGDMYDLIISLYLDILEDKKKLRELKNANNTITELKENLETYKTELESARKNLLVLENLNRAK